MPDPARMLEALVAAAISAAAVLLLFGLWRRSRPRWAAAGAVLAVAVGFGVGCVWLGLRPHWPPREDQDRLLLILLPAVVAVELLAVLVGKWVWPARLMVASGAGWVLLYGSVYVTELAGPGSREWTPGQTWLILGVLAAALLVVWSTLTTLARRTGGRSASLALALACAGAALTVMLSGYASGGQIGVPLAGAMAGVGLASLFRSGQDSSGATGVALVGLFALLVIGRFFGQLTMTNAVLLFFAPLLAWVPELAPLRSLSPWLRGPARVVLAAAPVVLVVWLAQQKFMVESARPATTSQEGSLEDYLNYGK